MAPQQAFSVIKAEKILQLFDAYWFKKVPFPKIWSLSAHVTEAIQEIDPMIEELKFSDLKTIQVRSLSDQCLSFETNFSPVTPSPRSVINKLPKLEKILSGIEVSEFANGVSADHEMLYHEKPNRKTESGNKRRQVKRRRRSRNEGMSSKSLSDLEYEELKGFMDLGFVFTEEDKSSSLASIIPGLQRWGKKGSDERVEISNDVAVSRPYLSESWEFMEQKKAKRNLMRWRFPGLQNEMNVKKHIRIWAHTVASTVR